MRRRIALTAAVIVLAVGGAGCSSDDDEETAEDDAPTATTVALEAADIRFTPTEIQLKAGEAVEFEVENNGQLLHNLTIEDLDVDQDVEGGETVRVPVTPDAGTYTFICEYHPDQMTGTITVS